mmetsp:Transcript_34642/g.80886  ORF Transcript_34642/g.80886 Transcript_34642/m.80886 type:complete len:552 (-) Transcript_34642:130-1785(-)
MSGFGERLSQRQKNFKKGVDAEDARRKREDAAIQLRKQQRDEALQKKRMVNGAEPEIAGPLGQSLNTAAAPAMQDTAAGGGQMMERIPQLAQMLMSEEPQVQFNATQSFRKMLSVEQSPPIQAVIQAGIVGRFIEFLKRVNQPDLQFEAAWVLTNIASGTADQTRVVVEHGALPIFIELLQSPNDDVREQAVWALGNIAGDSPNFRDLVLQCGALPLLNSVLRACASQDKTSMMRNSTWALSNLCRGKPPPPFEWVSAALPTLAQLTMANDVEVLTDSCWALSYLADGPNERIQGVIASGICPRLVDLLQHSSPMVQTPALRAAGNIVTGDDQQTQVILQCGALPALHKLLSHQKKVIRKETCWMLSNITAGNRGQIQEVINEGLIPPVLTLLATADFDIKKEAAWAISNVTSGGSAQQIEFLVSCGCIKPMVDVLTIKDAKIVGVALECLDNILKTGKQVQAERGLPDNPWTDLVEQADGLSRLEKLQEDTNDEIYQKAMGILERYFALEDDGFLDDSNTMTNNNGQPYGFQFGAQVPQGGFNFGGQMPA